MLFYYFRIPNIGMRNRNDVIMKKKNKQTKNIQISYKCEWRVADIIWARLCDDLFCGGAEVEQHVVDIYAENSVGKLDSSCISKERRLQTDEATLLELSK